MTLTKKIRRMERAAEEAQGAGGADAAVSSLLALTGRGRGRRG